MVEIYVPPIVAQDSSLNAQVLISKTMTKTSVTRHCGVSKSPLLDPCHHDSNSCIVSEAHLIFLLIDRHVLSDIYIYVYDVVCDIQ